MKEKNNSHILIVDDAPANIQALAEVLHEEYDISVALNGQDAIKLTDTNHPDMILLDIRMPGMDGYEVCRILKSLDNTKHIPVIFVTSLDEEQDEEKGLALGAVDYITKPFKTAIVTTRIKNHLERYRIERELRKEIEFRERAQKQMVQSEKLASLGRLVAGVAHEVNTPVGIGITSASHLKKITQKVKNLFENSEMSKSDLEEYFSDADKLSELLLTHLNKTSDLIESFKKVSTDQTSHTRRLFNLQSYLKDILKSIGSLLKDTSFKVEINCPDDIVLDSYPGAFAHVITNLTLNSLIHAFEGTDSGNIKIDVFRENGYIMIEYKDTGSGIAKKDMEKIFDPFYTTKRGKGCTGLGLHIVYNSVNHALGGEIECTSKEGEGACFLIRLPEKI